MQPINKDKIEKLGLFNIYFRSDLNRSGLDLVQPRKLVASLPANDIVEVFQALCFPDDVSYRNLTYEAYKLPRQLQGGDIIEQCYGEKLQYLVYDINAALIVITKKYLDKKVMPFNQDSIYEAQLRINGLHYVKPDTVVHYPLTWRI